MTVSINTDNQDYYTDSPITPNASYESESDSESEDIENIITEIINILNTEEHETRKQYAIRFKELAELNGCSVDVKDEDVEDVEDVEDEDEVEEMIEDFFNKIIKLTNNNVNKIKEIIEILNNGDILINYDFKYDDDDEIIYFGKTGDYVEYEQTLEDLNDLLTMFND